MIIVKNFNLSCNHVQDDFDLCTWLINLNSNYSHLSPAPEVKRSCHFCKVKEKLKKGLPYTVWAIPINLEKITHYLGYANEI